MPGPPVIKRASGRGRLTPRGGGFGKYAEFANFGKGLRRATGTVTVADGGVGFELDRFPFAADATFFADATLNGHRGPHFRSEGVGAIG